MIKGLRQLFATPLEPRQEDLEQQLRLTSAALMVEIMVVDRHLDEQELQHIESLLKQQFLLNDEEIDELLQLTKTEVNRATSLYQYTRLINNHYDARAKARLIENLWRVAFADQQLDKYEEGLIRQIAELLYVPHKDFIQAKQRALGKPIS
ncbi:tellurite resistance TerB family protein [Porticoccus sp.]